MELGTYFVLRRGSEKVKLLCERKKNIFFQTIAQKQGLNTQNRARSAEKKG